MSFGLVHFPPWPGGALFPALYESHKRSLCSFSVVPFPDLDSFPQAHSDQQLDEDLEDRLPISRTFLCSAPSSPVLCPVNSGHFGLSGLLALPLQIRDITGFPGVPVPYIAAKNLIPSTELKKSQSYILSSV